MQIKVKPHNKIVYMDILKDIIKKRSGVLSLTLTIHQGQIIDYVYTETKRPNRRSNGRPTG